MSLKHSQGQQILDKLAQFTSPPMPPLYLTLGSQRAVPSHWSLPTRVKGEKIQGKPQRLHLHLFPIKYPGVSAVTPEDGERQRDSESPFSRMMLV